MKVVKTIDVKVNLSINEFEYYKKMSERYKITVSDVINLLTRYGVTLLYSDGDIIQEFEKSTRSRKIYNENLKNDKYKEVKYDRKN